MDDILAAALHEIACEGPTGCPLTTLWGYIQNAVQEAELSLDDHLKQMLWTHLRQLQDLQIVCASKIAGSTPAALGARIVGGQLTDSARGGLSKASLAGGEEGIGGGDPWGKPQPAGGTKAVAAKSRNFSVVMYAIPAIHPSIQKVKDAESVGVVGVRVVAPKSMRDAAMGIYEMDKSEYSLTDIQYGTLERLAKARRQGVLQNLLAKEFNMNNNNYFYVVRRLEALGLAVRRPTLIRDSKVKGKAVTTNTVYLSRYAQEVMLDHNQRLEMLIDMTGRAGMEDPLGGEDLAGKAAVADDVPALRMICEKLEEVDGKVLVEAELKVNLGYRLASGHRAWRRLKKRLEDAGVIQVFPAQVDEKVVNCVRLLKKFSMDALRPGDEDGEADMQRGMRQGEISELLAEVPLENQIYDMVHEAGPAGLLVTELFKRLGLDNKRNYFRVSALLASGDLLCESENVKRQTLYRLKTAEFAQLHAAQKALADEISRGGMLPLDNASVAAITMAATQGLAACSGSMVTRTPDVLGTPQRNVPAENDHSFCKEGDYSSSGFPGLVPLGGNTQRATVGVNGQGFSGLDMIQDGPPCAPQSMNYLGRIGAHEDGMRDSGLDDLNDGAARQNIEQHGVNASTDICTRKRGRDDWESQIPGAKNGIEPTVGKAAGGSGQGRNGRSQGAIQREQYRGWPEVGGEEEDREGIKGMSQIHLQSLMDQIIPGVQKSASMQSDQCP